MLVAVAKIWLTFSFQLNEQNSPPSSGAWQFTSTLMSYLSSMEQMATLVEPIAKRWGRIFTLITPIDELDIFFNETHPKFSAWGLSALANMSVMSQIETLPSGWPPITYPRQCSSVSWCKGVHAMLENFRFVLIFVINSIEIDKI